MARSLAASVDALSAASIRTAWDPWNDIDWPDAVSDDEWCMSPELTSLYGTPEWNALGSSGQVALARYEAVNFFSLNIHGERLLMEGIARRLYRPHLQGLARYLHHFLEEENRHSAAFAMFCERYGPGVYPDRKIPAAATTRPTAEDDFVFFAQIMVFEEIVDVYNVTMARDQRLAPIVREINARHHADESRHLAFGRALVADLAEKARFDADARDRLTRDLSDFLAASWREYANPSVYRDAGCAEPSAARRSAWRASAFRARRIELSAKPIEHLTHLGFPVEMPA